MTEPIALKPVVQITNLINTHKSRDVTRKIFYQCVTVSRDLVQNERQGGILIYRTVGPRIFKNCAIKYETFIPTFIC